MAGKKHRPPPDTAEIAIRDAVTTLRCEPCGVTATADRRLMVEKFGLSTPIARIRFTCAESV
jgi:hypothetical protein